MKTTSAITLLGAVAMATSSPVKRANDGINDTIVLNYALTLEHLENAFYSEALAKLDEKAFTDAGLPSKARGMFEQVAAHEQAHVDFLSAALGSDAVKPCNYSFPYNGAKEFAAVSQILEGVGVSAYAGAAQYIKNPDYLTAAAVVLSTEARHASWVAAAVNDVEPWSGALDVPLTLDEVYSLAASFITSCPDSNPALPVKAFPALTYSPTSAMPGDSIDLQFNGSSDGQLVFFLTGLTPLNSTISDGKVTIPKELNGTVYMIVANANATAVSDNSTVAGPVVLQFQKELNSSSSNSSSSDNASSSTSTDADNGAVGSGMVSMSLLLPLVALVALFA